MGFAPNMRFLFLKYYFFSVRQTFERKTTTRIISQQKKSETKESGSRIVEEYLLSIQQRIKRDQFKTG